MKTFKQFVGYPEEIAIFCNAGGRIGQYDKIKFPEDNKKETAIFCNAGGPSKQYENCELAENLNPRTDPKFIRSNSSIFTDPEKNNHQLGHENNTPENVGIPSEYGTNYVVPHNTAEHAKYSRILSNNVRDSDDYHDIISKYTTNSHILNKTLHDYGINGAEHPQHIQANEDEDSEIDTDKLDHLIHSHLTPHEITVYSGLHFNPQHRGNKIYVNHPYMSTSLNPHVAKDFGSTFSHINRHGEKEFVKHVLRIIVPKHYPHLFTDNSSIFPGQSEILLPRHTRFQLGQKPTHIIVGHFNDHFSDTPHRGGEQTYHIWTGRLLPRN